MLHLERAAGYYSIRTYGAGYIQLLPPDASVSEDDNPELEEDEPGIRIEQTLLLTPDEYQTAELPTRYDELTAEMLTNLVNLSPEVVLIGSGRTMATPNPHFIKAMHENGIGLEMMDTGAACRTFNVLASEGRKVVSLLFVE